MQLGVYLFWKTWCRSIACNSIIEQCLKNNYIKFWAVMHASIKL